MENPTTQTATYQPYNFEFATDTTFGDNVETRLNALLAIQRENDRENSLYKTEKERFEASLIKHPVATDKAFSYFGLLLGLVPPYAMFSKFIYNNVKNGDDVWIVPLLLFVNLVCAGVGYFSGKLIGKMVAETEKWSWSAMLLISPFIGILWGMMSGGAGGLFIFVIGAIFGAIIAGMVGGVAFPVFTVLHRWLKKGDVIERNQFLPIAIGITLAISAFFLSLPIR